MKDLSRRDFLKVLAAATAAETLPTSLWAADAAGDRPNVIYIMSDDHASHAIGAYGSRINKTPHIDRIAREGMRLNNCFCTNSICGPSRAVLLTGKYSHVNGFIRNGNRFDGAQQTLPKLLGGAGYQTAMIGKWHLGSDPTGFDYWNILPGQGAYHNPAMIEMGRRTKHTGYVTDIITDLSIEWIRKRDKKRPFCLLCHHKAPHRNWQPDAKHAKMYEGVDIPEPETFHDDYATRSAAAAAATMRIDRDLNRSDVKGDPPKGLSAAEVKKWKYQRYIKDYLRCIASVDDNVGRLLDFLDAEGLAENTVVVYTSDQGFYLGDHNWFDKRFMYEPSLRMPFLVRYPREIKAGTVSDDIAVNIDFAPTFLDYAGQAAPADIQGRSFRQVLRGKTPADWRTSMYYHYYEYPAVHSVKRHYGVRTGRYKLIHFYYDIDAWELYDLQTDPNELKNLYADPKYADVVKQLKAELEKLRTQYGDSDELAAKLMATPRKGPPAVGVQLHLALDEAASAKAAVDRSGHKRKAVYHGTAPAEGPGQAGGKARRFDGKADYVDVPRGSCPAPRATPVTVSAWVQPSKADGAILAHGGASWGYVLHVAGGKAAFSTRIADKLTTATAAEKLPDGWVHLAGHLAADGAMAVFVNGKPAGAAKAAGLLAQDPHDSLQVGADRGSHVTDAGDNFFAGLIGHVKVTYGKGGRKDIAREAAE